MYQRRCVILISKKKKGKKRTRYIEKHTIIYNQKHRYLNKDLIRHISKFGIIGVITLLTGKQKQIDNNHPDMSL